MRNFKTLPTLIFVPLDPSIKIPDFGNISKSPQNILGMSARAISKSFKKTEKQLVSKFKSH
jgi:hypothetical protein